MKSPIVYYGGKTLLAQKISSLAPLVIDKYIEPFMGSAAVFFARPRWAKIEILNDLNGDVVNFFRVLRDKPDQLIKRLQWTPHARQEIRDSTHFIKSGRSSDVTRALYFFVRAHQSFSANMRETGGWSIPVNKSKAKGWQNTTSEKRLYAVAKRLMNVSLENNPALVVMAQYDSPRSFMYLDPPYLSVANERAKKSSYQGLDMQEKEHKEFIDTVLGFQSMMILSGYDHPIYIPLVENGWSRIDIPVHTTAGNQKNKKMDTKRTEVLWLSPNIPGSKIKQIALF